MNKYSELIAKPIAYLMAAGLVVIMGAWFFASGDWKEKRK